MTQKEAIERVRTRFDRWALDNEDLTALRALGLVDAESEDEKIRKDIINLIYWLKGNPSLCSQYYNDRYDGMLAYLEKQKVKVYDDTPYYTPEEVNAKIEEPTDVIPKIPRQEYLYHLLANGVITFSDYEFLMRNKGRKPADLSEMMVHKEPYIAPVPTPMIADEQKPIPQEERNDEKNILEDIIVFVSGYADKRVVTKWVSFLKSLRPQLKYEWSEEERKILDSIIDDYEKAARSFCGYDGKIGLLRAIRDGEYDLPKQEWSEEDEAHRDFILESLEDQIRFCKKDAEGAHYAKQIRTAQNWLKFLPLNLKKKNEDVAKLCSNEWSEEDEKIAKEIEEELWYPGDFPDYPSKEESELYDDCQRRLDWFKNKLKSLRPQPKAELTLLDENIINAAVAFVEQNNHFNYWGGIDKRTVIKALRSLKPHWRPSEVQLSMLLAVINEPRNAGAESCHLALSNLYEDLRKLK